ncbi:hypothetical protein AQUCO_10000007v1 [Aquilegia coerulea]|uniref:Uncharacterized protein n=1 Tax=Aquilegia coerulea TaxID=218851 RepID=A0A2G5C461_AQUCA|nr:hypothetical protein AQUCO_10000007v1 [Aquilegia coerulea]
MKGYHNVFEIKRVEGTPTCFGSMHNLAKDSWLAGGTNMFMACWRHTYAEVTYFNNSLKAREHVLSIIINIPLG